MSSQLVFAGAAFGRHFVFGPHDGDLVPLAAASPCPIPSLPTPAWPRPVLPVPDPAPPPGPAPSALTPFVDRLRGTPRLAGITPAARLEIRPAPAMIPSGIAAIDSLTGGLPRSCLSEICGPASSGRSSVLLAALAAATRRQEICALVDTTDSLAIESVAAAGLDLQNFLWIRCAAEAIANEGEASRPAVPVRREKLSNSPKGKRFNPVHANFAQAVEQALRITDLLLQSGGFGFIAIDVGDVPIKIARRIPLTSWFRFRRSVENTDTVLLVIAQQSCAQTCASLVLRLHAEGVVVDSASGKAVSAARLSPCNTRATSAGTAFIQSTLAESTFPPAHAQVLEALRVQVELLRSRLPRKAPQSVGEFEMKTRWAG
ncbi:MAG TPA: hypothetical protein VFA89_11515 [Terriglobales bacterium]|nr:hypothetical protein [Terriglobales bacterium]